MKKTDGAQTGKTPGKGAKLTQVANSLPQPVLFMLNGMPGHEYQDRKQGFHDYNADPKGFQDAAKQEKIYIFPHIEAAFKSAVADGTFYRKEDRVLDIGCGPFLLSLPFLRAGVTVDGVDSSDSMLTVAEGTLTGSHFETAQSKPKNIKNQNGLPKSEYGFAMMNFVHQCCPNKESLKALMKMAYDVLKPGSRLFVSGAHPEYLDVKHALCEYDIPDVSKLRDGTKYTGKLFNTTNGAQYDLHGDHYWRLDTLISAAKAAGFSHDTGATQSINDIEPLSETRVQSKEPAYFGMTFTKP